MDNITTARIHLFSILGSFYINGSFIKDVDYIRSVLQAIVDEPFVDGIETIASSMIEYIDNKQDDILQEYEVLFNLPFGDFINTSISYYYDDREFGTQTIITKDIMHKAGYIKADFFSLGEDDYGLVCAICARLLKDGKSELQKELFTSILAPNIDKFVDRQLNSSRAEFYKLVAKLFILVVVFEKNYHEYYS